MANSNKPKAAGTGPEEAPVEHHIEGSRVVSADYGMPGSKGLASPILPLMWLLVPFLFCLGYGILTR
jgi:hypothetical protein